MPTAPIVGNQNTVLGVDAALLSIQNIPAGGGSAPSAVSFLGSFETAELSLKRDFTDTTGAADGASSSRAVRWGKGSVRVSGFMRGAASSYAAIFASGSHAMLQFQDVATGDSYQVIVTLEGFSKSIGKEATKDSIELGVESAPFLNGAVMTLA